MFFYHSVFQKSRNLRVVVGHIVSSDQIALMARNQVLQLKPEFSGENFKPNTVCVLTLPEMLIAGTYLSEKYYRASDPQSALSKFLSKNTGYDLEQIHVILGNNGKHAEQLVLDDACSYFETLNHNMGPHVFNLFVSSLHVQ